MLTIAITSRVVNGSPTYQLETRVANGLVTRVPCGRNESGLAEAKALASALADLHRAQGYRVVFA